MSYTVSAVLEAFPGAEIVGGSVIANFGKGNVAIGQVVAGDGVLLTQTALDMIEDATPTQEKPAAQGRAGKKNQKESEDKPTDKGSASSDELDLS